MPDDAPPDLSPYATRTVPGWVYDQLVELSLAFNRGTAQQRADLSISWPQLAAPIARVSGRLPPPGLT